ncbi:antimicrobial peptide D2-like [Cryptomeria japonica]|nr:antimicrobial peptide D2-like [Cryptomeria japonica]
MAKSESIYACLVLLLLLTASFASASDSASAAGIEVSEGDNKAVCRKWSARYMGICINSDQCNEVCIDGEHALFGKCKWRKHGPACFCYFHC